MDWKRLLDLSPDELTALSNSQWSGVSEGAVVCLGIMLWWGYRPDAEMIDATKRGIKWLMLVAICSALHREYWNLALFLSDIGVTYHVWLANHKQWLGLFVLGIVVGTTMTLKELVPPVYRTRALTLWGIWLLVKGTTAIYWAQ